MKYRTGIGQDSHRFSAEDLNKPCILGGLIFEGVPGLISDSDGDVVYHAICNAITSITGIQILGGIAADLYEKEGITDSEVYLQKAVETLGSKKIEHIALSIEGKQPRLNIRIEEMRTRIAKVLRLEISQVGISATTSDGLTEFGLGAGIQCLCVITTQEYE